MNIFDLLHRFKSSWVGLVNLGNQSTICKQSPPTTAVPLGKQEDDVSNNIFFN